MPELPELEVIANRLTERLTGSTVQKVKVHNHIVIHGMTAGEFEENAVGETFLSFRPDGKFVIMELDEHDLVVNPMLTGRFRLLEMHHTPTKTDMFSVGTDTGTLWYYDRKRMGRAYLVPKGDYSNVAGFSGRGPSALAPALTFEIFKDRLRKHRGQIKNVLRNQRFVKGIGNAYADEILLYGGILPFRRRSTLSNEEVVKLYEAMRTVLTRVLEIISNRNLNELGTEKRDFLMIHNRGGGMCPLCGGRVSEVTANRFKTNYCQTCQK
ncbi:MAG: DNA-formamidopyrimidine glycosylase family protein [Candidatus Thorarchaeota archaeon]|jgi:formamidopyrimidine-DNA glycosylase